MDMAYLRRQPGIIKQSSSSQNRRDDRATQTSTTASVNVNLSHKNLFEFPYQFDQAQTHSIADLNVDCNSIRQCVFNTAYFPNLATLSFQYNNLTKFQVKSLHVDNSCLAHINLSHNNLQFLDLSLLPSLRTLILSHNNLSTIILPQPNLATLDISYNAFSNIQYSVLSNKIFNKLTKIDVSHNKRSLYDLILAVEDRQLVPNLIQLNCGYNVVSYFQHLPANLQLLNFQSNQLVFDRRSVNEIIKLKKLKELVLSGNTVSDSFLQIIQSRKRQTKCIITYQKEQESFFKQSPYRLYQSPTHEPDFQLTSTNKIKIKNNDNNDRRERNFTLGEEISNRDEDEIDPYYYLIQETPKLENKLETEEDYQLEDKKIEEIDLENVVLKETENKLKNNKVKVKIQGLRYLNHYKLYFDKLVQFMMIPPHPIPHSDRNANISVRIDPPEDTDYLNQYPLLNEMLKSRGGIHYLRKVFNWASTQESLSSSWQISIVFISMQLSKEQFNEICNGNYERVQEAMKSKHNLNQQPSSFSCYHILARLCTNEIVRWSCLYLIEAVHL